MRRFKVATGFSSTEVKHLEELLGWNVSKSPCSDFTYNVRLKNNEVMKLGVMALLEPTLKFEDHTIINKAIS